MGYFKTSVKGVSWVGAFRVSSRIVAFIRTIILARLLDPTAYGLFGIITLVVSFLEIFTETGVNVVLIQKRDEIDKYINTAWVVSIIRGTGMAIVIIALAGLISSFFQAPNAFNLLLLASLIPFIRGFINPSEVKFQKELKFSQEFWFRFAIFTLDSFTAIIFSLILRSAAGLVLGLISGAILEVIMSHVWLSPRPKFRFKGVQLREILSKGKWLTGASIFQFSFSQGDDIVVGRLLGASQLGIYQLAYNISGLPISEITDVFNRVLFPVYVKISADKNRLKRAFFKTTVTVSILATTLGVFIFLFSDPIVRVLLGDKWLAAIPILRILALFGVIQAINNSIHSLLLAIEGQKYVTVITFINTAGMLLPIIPLIQRFGLPGAPYAVLIGTLCALPITLFSLAKVFSTSK